MKVIEVKNLRKEYRITNKAPGLAGAIKNIFLPKYKTKIAVNNINFSIDEGEIVGYIGANGAGKSTTIKMLTGILTPSGGEVLINGVNPQKNRIKNNKQIGTVFGQRTQLWWDLPVIESYNLLQRIYEIPPEVYQANLEKFKEILDLKDLLGIPVRQLSLGQKMRCEIAAAFLHNPKVVYLDEPTIGLDVMVKDKIREFIRLINQERKVTVILTTHDMQDIEEVCTRVMFVDMGQVIYDGDLETVKTTLGKTRTIQIQVKSLQDSLFLVLDKETSLKLINHSEHSLEIEFNREILTATQVMNIVSLHCEILDLSIQEVSIESIVKNLYSKGD
jgi:ABC-2 type transport system ATP-binding protein